MMNKKTHGGKREGAGRKPAPEPEFNKKFRAYKGEREVFESFLTGDARKDFQLIIRALNCLYASKSRVNRKFLKEINPDLETEEQPKPEEPKLIVNEIWKRLHPDD